MHERPRSVRSENGLEIVCRIGAFIARRAIADFEIGRVGVGAVNQVVGDTLQRESLRTCRAKARVLALSVTKRWASREDVDEFVLPAVPMQQGGLRARLQGRESRQSS